MVYLILNLNREHVFLIAWVMAWIIFAAVVIAAIMGIVKAEAQCYVVTMTENVVTQPIPWYYQIVPVIVGQTVSCY